MSMSCRRAITRRTATALALLLVADHLVVEGRPNRTRCTPLTTRLVTFVLGGEGGLRLSARG
jgi:hypothetical protein